MTQWHAETRDWAAKSLMNTLVEITESNVPEGIEADVCQFLSRAGELALCLGEQRARVQLLECRPGENVIIGPEFEHSFGALGCERGEERAAQILVRPGLCKIGNGRGEMQTRRVLLPAEIFYER